MKTRKDYISLFTIVSALLSLSAFVILKISISSEAFADALNSTVSTAIRRAFSLVSDLVPISIFEILMWLIPLGIIILTVASVRVFRGGVRRLRYILNLLGVVLLIYTFYVFTLAIPYHTTSLSDNIGLSEVDVTKENLYTTANILIDKINSLAEEIDYSGGESQMGYDMDALSEGLSASYKKIAEKHELFPAYSSRGKPIISSGVMSSLRLLGIYTFFTGESNINTAYPDFDRPFTTAHEFAHQRGIIRENEANFIAFLVCIEADDPFINYSGYLRLYEYVISSLYRADEDLWRAAASRLDSRARADISASNVVTEKYGNTFIGDLSNKLNDFYLKQNGTAGVASYGLVTRLAVAYYEAEAQ